MCDYWKQYSFFCQLPFSINGQKEVQEHAGDAEKKDCKKKTGIRFLCYAVLSPSFRTGRVETLFKNNKEENAKK